MDRGIVVPAETEAASAARNQTTLKFYFNFAISSDFFLRDA